MPLTSCAIYAESEDRFLWAGSGITQQYTSVLYEQPSQCKN